MSVLYSCNKLHATGVDFVGAQEPRTERYSTTFRVFTISCNKLHATGALFHIVACILMHERTTHGTLFTTFRVFTMSCNELHATRSIIPHRSLNLDARKNHARNVIHHLSGIHNFVCSVHLDAQPNHARNFIPPFRELTISCNKLHATGALFHIVACILMHE